MTNIEFIAGPAGSGKSTLIRQRLNEQGPSYTKLCATTGVAAANLSTVTLHSLLKFFKLEDLTLRRKKVLHILECLNVKSITIDEVSMLSGKLLDAVVDVLDDYNEGCPDQIDLVLTGDFCQLPPVDLQDGFAFDAKCWPRVKVTKLEKVWRQNEPKFLEALNLARKGQGSLCTKLLKDICEFASSRDADFPGLCLVATKAEAHKFNTINLEKISTPYLTYQSSRWGQQLTDWKDIPDQVSLKLNCRVKIRSNETKTFSYVSGDTGILVNHQPCMVKLDRTGLLVIVKPIIRYNEVPEPTDTSKVMEFCDPETGEIHRIHYIGTINYMPVEPGYASTIHSAQGLTLDSAQISLIDLTSFLLNRRQFGQNLVYVALSRVRNPANLRIHGSPQELASKVRLHPRVNSWI